MAEIHKNRTQVHDATDGLMLAISDMKRARDQFIQGINDKLMKGEHFVGESADMFGIAVSKVDEAIRDMTRCIQNAPRALDDMAQIIDHADLSGAGMY
jgi:hypothetical protein